MANETIITLVGNLTSDPTLRFTPSGAAVVNFTVASTPRSFDKSRNEWVDGEPMFLSCSAWRQMAENVAESLQKGMGVIVQGRLKSRSYTTKEGDKRAVLEVDVEDVGPSLRWASASVQRNHRSGQAPSQRRQEQPWQPPSGVDPWAQTHHDQRGQQGGQQAQSDAPPF